MRKFNKAGVTISVALIVLAFACGAAFPAAGPPVKAQVPATGGNAFEVTTSGYAFSKSAMGYIGNTYLMGWRFENLAIPQGAQITSAVIDLYVYKPATADVSVKFYGEATENSEPFTNTRYGLSTRAATAASVNSNLTSWNKAQTWYKTPDLSPIIQEIVQNPAWQSGNSLAILCANMGTKGKITLYNIEKNVVYAARLTVTYNTTAAATPTTWEIDLDDDGIPDLDLYDADADGYFELPCGKLEFVGTFTINKPVEVPGCADSSRGLSIVKGDGIIIKSGGFIIGDLDSPVVSSPPGTKGNDLQIIGRNFVTMEDGSKIMLSGDYEGSGAGDIYIQTLRTGAEIVLDGKGVVNGRSVTLNSSGAMYLENGFSAVAGGNMILQTLSHDIRLMHNVYMDATLIGGSASIAFKTEGGSVYLVDKTQFAAEYIDMTKVKGTVNNDGTTVVLGTKLGW